MKARLLAILCLAAIAGQTGVHAQYARPASESKEYQPPRPLPFPLTVDTVTVGELASSPATKAILESIQPGLGTIGKTAFLGAYTLPQLRYMLPKATAPETIARVNKALAALPHDEWPVK